MQPDRPTPSHGLPPPGGAVERPAPLDYGVARPSPSARSWAWAFLLSGGYALACIPAVFIFERVGWSDDPVNFTSFFAWIICAVSAAKYLWTSRATVAGEAAGATRSLAYVALALAGGFLLLFALLVVLLANSLNDL